jgi:hypothetical protein
MLQVLFIAVITCATTYTTKPMESTYIVSLNTVSRLYVQQPLIISYEKVDSWHNLLFRFLTRSLTCQVSISHEKNLCQFQKDFVTS